MKTWDRIDSLLKEGKEPVIVLRPSMAKKPLPGKPGRPRKLIVEKTEAEKAAQPLLGDSTRPRCLNPHCRQRLKAGATQVCNANCKELAIASYQAVVDLLKGPANVGSNSETTAGRVRR